MAERTEDVGWSGLFDALGPATDTPWQLEALLGDDAGAFVGGYAHLWSTTLRRDGRAWPATAPTALLVVDLLDDPLLGPDDPALADAMLVYLYAVAVAADLGDRAADPDPGGGPYAGSAELDGRLPVGRAADSPYDLATILIAIGHRGGDTRTWLGHPHAGVRGSAAPAPARGGDDGAAQVLQRLAQSPHAFRTSFGDLAPPLQFQFEPHQNLLTSGPLRWADSAGARASPGSPPPAGDH
ncbi:hypothetical protein [Kitasatospora sp. NPDC059571]|uniref:hypothetical protein n=1 Tax=Kitasatospora sp. NPDC059571 TaxID=3346871 RepID=UPI0036761368